MFTDRCGRMARTCYTRVRFRYDGDGDISYFLRQKQRYANAHGPYPRWKNTHCGKKSIAYRTKLNATDIKQSPLRKRGLFFYENQWRSRYLPNFECLLTTVLKKTGKLLTPTGNNIIIWAVLCKYDIIVLSYAHIWSGWCEHRKGVVRINELSGNTGII